MSDILGCDVSKWQGTVDFTKMAGKLRFVIIKLSQGTTPDPYGAANWANSRGTGLKRAAYHYFEPTIDGVAQANAFLGIMAGDYGDFGPCCDIETPRYAWTGDMVARLRTFLDRVEAATTRIPIIYTAEWYMAYLGRPAWLTRYPLWVASYTAAPIVPKPWNAHHIWQYSSSGKGPDYGVQSAALDLNRFNGDEAAFAEFVGAPANTDTQRTTSAAVVYAAGPKISAGTTVQTGPGDGELLALLSVGGTPQPSGRYIRATFIEDIPAPTPEPPPHPSFVVPFSATPPAVTAGQAVTLRWQIGGIAGIWLDGQPEAGDLNGKPVERTRYPQASTTYTLSVQYSDGSSEQFKQSVTVTAPSVVQIYPALGINCVVDAREGDKWVAAGVPAYSDTFNPQHGADVKRAHPNMLVGIRGLLNKGYLPSLGEWRNSIQQGLNVNGMYIFGLNEQDQVGASPADIRARIAWDKAALAMVKAEAKQRGITLYFVGGGFSVGETNIVDENVVIAMSGYAELMEDPAFRFNQHLYAAKDGRAGLTREQIRDIIFDESYIDMPSRRYDPKTQTWTSFTERVEQAEWTMLRWRFYYRRCGWNPAGAGRIVCDETGLEVGGGSFPVMDGCDDAFMQRWARAMVRRQGAPFSVMGKLYTSPVEFMNIFQTGSTDWRTYEMASRLQALKACGFGRS